MKIEGDRHNPAVDTAAATPVTGDAAVPAHSTAPAAGKDKVALSHDAELFAAASRAAQAEPAVREELVEKRKNEIADTGGLAVDPGQLADQLIDDLLGK